MLLPCKRIPKRRNQGKSKNYSEKEGEKDTDFLHFREKRATITKICGISPHQRPVNRQKNMPFHPEIKEFTKNTLILTLFFTLVLHLSWGYIAPYLGLGASAGNDAHFIQTDPHYMGSMATALSINIGQKLSGIKKGSVDLANDVISIAEVLASPKDGERRLIASNMLSLSAYVNILKTDIVALLDQSTDRTVALDDHIDLLKSYYTRTSDRTLLITEQVRDLQAILASAISKTTLAKVTMEEKYKGFEYE